MHEEELRRPMRVDSTVPNIARIWDWQLGGKDNFEADRRVGEALNHLCRDLGVPDGRAAAKENRAFIRRAVRYLAGEAGLTQFLDLGSGLPSMGNVHEIAQAANPAARVVYIDYDPIVVAHGRALLADGIGVEALEGDLRKPSEVLDRIADRGLLNLDQPVAVLMVAMLHCLYDHEDPWHIVSQIRQAIAPGSHLALTHLTVETYGPAAEALASEIETLGASTPLVPRSRTQIEHLFDGFEMVYPGLVYTHEWRPEKVGGKGAIRWLLGGLGRTV